MTPDDTALGEAYRMRGKMIVQAALRVSQLETALRKIALLALNPDKDRALAECLRIANDGLKEKRDLEEAA